MPVSFDAYDTSNPVINAINILSGRNNNSKVIPRLEGRVSSRFGIITVKGDENLSLTICKRGEVLVKCVAARNVRAYGHCKPSNHSF